MQIYTKCSPYAIINCFNYSVAERFLGVWITAYCGDLLLVGPFARI